MNRRDLLAMFGTLVLLPNGSDRKTIIDLFNKCHIDMDMPSKDGTPNAISVSVNGSEVVGPEDGMIVFEFTARGTLKGIVIWNKKFSNTH